MMKSSFLFFILLSFEVFAETDCIQQFSQDVAQCSTGNYAGCFTCTIDGGSFNTCVEDAIRDYNKCDGGQSPIDND